MITDQGFTGNHTLSYLGASTNIAADGTSTYSYDPAGNVVGIGVQGGTASQGQIAYTDKHTDVVGAFTPSGTSLTASAAYDPWGTVVATSATAIPGSLGFQSAYSGSGDGLVDMGSRWYYPGGHTFITKDTQSNGAVPDSADANPFSYGADDPLGVPTHRPRTLLRRWRRQRDQGRRRGRARPDGKSRSSRRPGPKPTRSKPGRRPPRPSGPPPRRPTTPGS